MQFNFSYATGVSQIQMQAFEMAGKIWSSYLTDNTTINIAVDFQSGFLGNTIAGAIGRVNQIGFPTFKTALINDSSSVTDQLAATTANVKGGDVSARLDERDTKTNTFRDLYKNGSKLNVNTANAKAVGLAVTGNANLLDGYIVMRDLTGTTATWDYNLTRTGSTPTTAVDFMSVAIHEIGHVLGFQSSVDQPWLNPILDTSNYNNSLASRVNLSTPLDLFRYSDKGGIKQGDLAAGGNPYFSFSPTAIAGYFDSGTLSVFGGNGFQASHFVTGGIMDAEIMRGTRSQISTLDLTAFDAIGWNIDPLGVNKVINYSQLALQSQQAASLKVKQDISSSIGVMLDNSFTMARGGGFWQEFFARGGGFWQNLSQVFNEQTVFDSLDGEDLLATKFPVNQDTTASDDQNLFASQPITDNPNPLTGKVDGEILVGDIREAMSFYVDAAKQSINNFNTFQPYLDFQNNDILAIKQQTSSNNIDFGASSSTDSTFPNSVSLGSKSDLNSVISNNSVRLGAKSDLNSLVLSNNSSLLDSSPFTPWWLSETSW